MSDNFPIVVMAQLEKKKITSQVPASAVTMANNSITGNTIDGDLNLIGIQNNFAPPLKNPRALAALLERSKLLLENSEEYREMVEELQSFLTARSDRNVIGLESKLNNGGRPDLVEDGLYLESRFARRIAKGQNSPSNNAMYLHCLSEINSSFVSHIHPLIRAGASAVVIDAAIKLYVIDPIYEELASVDCSITAQLVRGMLYFLTGKCHLAWT